MDFIIGFDALHQLIEEIQQHGRDESEKPQRNSVRRFSSQQQYIVTTDEQLFRDASRVGGWPCIMLRHVTWATNPVENLGFAGRKHS